MPPNTIKNSRFKVSVPTPANSVSETKPKDNDELEKFIAEADETVPKPKPTRKKAPAKPLLETLDKDANPSKGYTLRLNEYRLELLRQVAKETSKNLGFKVSQQHVAAKMTRHRTHHKQTLPCAHDCATTLVVSAVHAFDDACLSPP